MAAILVLHGPNLNLLNPRARDLRRRHAGRYRSATHCAGHRRRPPVTNPAKQRRTRAHRSHPRRPSRWHAIYPDQPRRLHAHQYRAARCTAGGSAAVHRITSFQRTRPRRVSPSILLIGHRRRRDLRLWAAQLRTGAASSNRALDRLTPPHPTKTTESNDGYTQGKEINRAA
jgi:hypothetical protein